MKSMLAIAATATFAVFASSAFASESCKTPAADGKEAHSHCGAVAADAAAQVAVYKATGSVKNINKAAGKVTIAHDAIPELHWPAMTMSFGVADRKLLDELSAGKKVDFRFVQRGHDYIVTALY